ncbi:MAG: hypothetical protein V9G14_14480 [Cypionkella sp.]
MFGYWEYHGSDFAADAAIMAADPTHPGMVGGLTDALPGPAAQPRTEGEWWAMMEEVFHHD